MDTTFIEVVMITLISQLFSISIQKSVGKEQSAKNEIEAKTTLKQTRTLINRNCSRALYPTGQQPQDECQTHSRQFENSISFVSNIPTPLKH
jgi:hypothetical protein